jgi:hypothetical protein
MHSTRRRTLLGITSYRGPARRDAPTDQPTDGGAGGGTGQGDSDAGKAGDQKPPTFTGDFDPDRAARALASARDGEKTAKAEAKAAKDRLAAVLKALGRNEDGTEATDPEAAATALTSRAETAEAAAWRAGVQLAVHRRAGKHGADAEALLDSMRFADSLDDLVDADPTTAEFLTAIDNKIKAAVAADPKLRATPTGGRVGAVSGGSGGGSEGRPKSLREAYARQNNT